MRYNLSIQQNALAAKEKLQHLIKKGAKIELTEKRGRRTLSQNAYLHLILSWWGLSHGYTLEESKQYFKDLNRNYYYYEKKGKTFIKSTSGVNTKELTIHIEQFRDWSAENGLYIPAPNEQHQIESIQNQLEIYGNKKYV